MTTDPIALLRDAENYLSALHGSVARHDNLAANLACAGCELRDRIAAALPELAAVSSAVVAPPTGQTALRERRERYAIAIHDAMETDLSLVDQEPAYQALIARAAEAAEALADAEQNRQFLTTLANLGITTHRLDRIRDAARLHRQQLLGTSELYAVIEADDEQPGARHVHITIHHPDPTTATTAALCIADLIHGEYSDSLRLTITTDAPDTGTPATTTVAPSPARSNATPPDVATSTAAVDLPTLAAALDGLHTLIATSSRDWQTYRVDAWLWAVLCGWDCEQTEHDDTCVHGALEETAARHGWDEATIAKARRYRAAVRAVTEHQPADETATETPAPSMRERHRAAWRALTPDQQAARLAELDAIDGPAAGARQDGAET